MKLYLDDDNAWPLLAKLLRNAGHDVQLPSDIGMTGSPDPAHFTRAIRDGRVCLTKNYDDYWLLRLRDLHGRVQEPPRRLGRIDAELDGAHLGRHARLQDEEQPDAWKSAKRARHVGIPEEERDALIVGG